MGAGSPPSPAVSRGGALPAVGPRASAPGLALAFIGFGLVALAVGVAWLAGDPGLLLLPSSHPRVVALAHLWLPGFLLSVTMGALYQLTPVVLGAAIPLPRAAGWIHLGLQALGVPVLVGGFVAGRYAGVAVGGAAVALGAGIVAAGVMGAFRRSTRRDAVAWSFPLAAGWLLVTVALGVLLALNRRWSFLPLGVLDLLKAHAHAGLAGFFLTLLQGATFQLVPMFTLADLRGTRRVKVGLVLGQLGLLLLVPGLACDRRFVALAGATLLGLGVAASGGALRATLRTRRRRLLEPGLRAFVLGAGLLALAGVSGFAMLVLPADLGGDFRGSWATAYGVAIIGGGLSFMLLGMLCKIVPFLVWMTVYGSRVGREPVPLATSLGARALESTWLAAQTVALAALVAGVAAGSIWLAGAGAGLQVVAMAAYLVNVARIGPHLRRTQGLVTPVPIRTQIVL